MKYLCIILVEYNGDIDIIIIIIIVIRGCGGRR